MLFKHTDPTPGWRSHSDMLEICRGSAILFSSLLGYSPSQSARATVSWWEGRCVGAGPLVGRWSISRSYPFRSGGYGVPVLALLGAFLSGNELRSSP